jgi:hypothetical protein
MPNIWVRSTDGDNGNAGTYDAPKATVAGAIAAASAGDQILCSVLHDCGYSANTTLTLNGVAIISVEDWDEEAESEPTPVYSAGARISCDGTATAALTMLGSGHAKGVVLEGGATNSSIRFLDANGTAGHIVLEDCTLAATGNSYVYLGSLYGDDAGATLELIDCTLNFGQSNSYPTQLRGGNVRMVGCTLGTATPNTVFSVVLSYGTAIAEFVNCDFSAAGAGKTLFVFTSSTSVRCYHCRSNASVVLASGSPDGATLEWIASDHGTNYVRQTKYDYQGTVTEDTVRVRDNSDSPYSYKLVSSANTKFYSPLRSIPFRRFNAVEGTPITVRVEVLTDGVTLTNGDFWPECYYLGSASYPLGSIASGAMANILSTPANLSTSSEGWTTTDLASPVKQYADLTFTPQKSGIIELVGCLAKASTTVYVDPDAEVS